MEDDGLDASAVAKLRLLIILILTEDPIVLISVFVRIVLKKAET